MFSCLLFNSWEPASTLRTLEPTSSASTLDLSKTAGIATTWVRCDLDISIIILFIYIYASNLVIFPALTV